MIKLRTNDLDCVMSKGRWSCKDSPAFEELLNGLEQELREDTLVGSDPNPEHTSAVFVIERLGGEIIRDDSTTRQHVRGRVY